MSEHTPSTRSFCVMIAPDRRAIVSVAIQEDVSIPTPLEKADWELAVPSHQDMRQVFAVLHSARSCAEFEIAYNRQNPAAV